MAYHSFDFEPALTVGRDSPLVESSHIETSDWDAVEIARRDGPRSVNPNSIIARLTRVFFGVEIARPLANERLETIRRFSVRAWFRRELFEKDLRPLFDLGFSSNDVWRLLAHIGERRGFIPEIERWPA